MAATVIRPANYDDIPTLIQLRWDVCVEQGVADPADGDSYERYRQAFGLFLETHLSEDHCQFFVVEAAGTIVGTATLWLFPVLPWPRGLNQWRGYVTNLYVVPSRRRQGLARGLMEALTQVARERGASELLLEASPDSVLLYQQMGFRPSKILELPLF